MLAKKETQQRELLEQDEKSISTTAPEDERELVVAQREIQKKTKIRLLTRIIDLEISDPSPQAKTQIKIAEQELKIVEKELEILEFKIKYENAATEEGKSTTKTQIKIAQQELEILEFKIKDENAESEEEKREINQRIARKELRLINTLLQSQISSSNLTHTLSHISFSFLSSLSVALCHMYVSVFSLSAVCLLKELLSSKYCQHQVL
jgi:hypothetical protein